MALWLIICIICFMYYLVTFLIFLFVNSIKYHEIQNHLCIIHSFILHRSVIIVNSAFKLKSFIFSTQDKRFQSNFCLPELRGLLVKILPSFDPIASQSISKVFHTSGTFCVDPVLLTCWPVFLAFALFSYKHEHFCYIITCMNFSHSNSTFCNSKSGMTNSHIWAAYRFMLLVPFYFYINLIFNCVYSYYWQWLSFL